MEIRFVVIGGGDSSRKFLFPVNCIFDDNRHGDGFAIGITKPKSEDFPDFDKTSKERWKKYLDEFNKFGQEDPVMHRRGSDRIVTPTPEELRASGNLSDSEADARGIVGRSGIFCGRTFFRADSRRVLRHYTGRT